VEANPVPGFHQGKRGRWILHFCRTGFIRMTYRGDISARITQGLFT
jgi:hypothetical protein